MFLTDVFISFFFSGQGAFHSSNQVRLSQKILQELVSQGHWVPGLRQEAVASQPCLHQSWVCLQSPCACYSPPHMKAHALESFFSNGGSGAEVTHSSFAQMLKVMALGRSRLPFSETPPRRKQV